MLVNGSGVARHQPSIDGNGRAGDVGRGRQAQAQRHVRHLFRLAVAEQGGAALGLNTTIPIELRTVVQGLVILFTGALNYMVTMMLAWIFSVGRARGAN